MMVVAELLLRCAYAIPYTSARGSFILLFSKNKNTYLFPCRISMSSFYIILYVCALSRGRKENVKIC